MNQALPRKGWILYDGSCGFCFRWVHFWEKVLVKCGFALKDLQTAFADGSLAVGGERLLDDIRVSTVDGRIIRGADAYLYVAANTWWARPFAFIFGLPGFRQIL